MPVVTRSRVSAARGDGAGALPWGSASAAPAPRHDASKSCHHHHGLKEKLRALTQDYEQQKQKQLLAASQGGGAAARQLRRSIRCLNATEVANDENAEEEDGRVAKRRYDAFALVPEAAVLRENVAPPQERAPSNDSHVVVLAPQAKENVVGRGANAMSCPIKKAVPALPVLPVPPARKLSLGGAVGGKLKAAGEAGAGTAEAAESRILVFVRLRPMSRKEKEAGSRSCVKIVNRKEVSLTEFASENDYLRLKRVRDSQFCFDSVFPDSTTQAEVYSTSTADLVEGVLQGRNGTVFCYGATGAGKTYTMLGTMENPGVMVLAIHDLFSKVTQRNHSIKLSYLEIYNETVRDLLSPGSPLNLREDKQGTVAAGLTQRSVYSTDEVMELLQKGNKNRTTEPTRVNETSSRSHAVLQTQTTVNEEVLDQPDSKTMLVLELQKQNSVLREQLAKQQQKVLIAEAQLLASKTLPQQSPAPSSHVATPGSTQRNTRRSILAGNHFNTLDSKRPIAGNTQVRELQRKVKTLESEIEKMKKEHILQLKNKDEFIRDMINRKAPNNCEEATCDRRVATRASQRKAQRDASAASDLKSPSHRFTSPAPTAKKRTFSDIGGNSPSVLAANGRKTRSHVATETPKKGSSKLLQPGFARQISSHRNI
ncbi:kinesin-like protein KIN-8A isoform X2 [Miscanthus floridulus]|uniref:kinesin-like protein KIN-8A isoform X2 n=1 Tax=Miscanthus floridulus TaxID=154761 RepID=UPI003459E366